MKHPLVWLSSIFLASAVVVSPAASAARGDAAKAEPIVNGVCGGCHGVDGNSMAPTFPKLAGLQFEYINKQLNDYKSGVRQNPTMAPMVSTLSSDDMLNLAAYFSAQSAKPGTAKDPALVTAGQKVYKGGNMGSGVPACASCHGPNGAGIPAQFPRLAGQHAEYVATQLRDFRTGVRSNDGAKMMQVIARKMTEQEMQAVAEYIAGLR
jgi:cytochrome c553